MDAVTFSRNAIPGALSVGVFVVYAGKQAGFPPTVWYPGALFLLALLVIWLVAQLRRGGLPQLPRAAVASVVFLAAFTMWSYLSILWSDVRGDAWDGANK